MNLPTRTLPDGRVLEVTPLTFARGRLHVSRPENVGLWYDDEW